MFGDKSGVFSKLVPQASAFLKQLEALNLPPIEHVPVGLSRDSYEKLARYQGGVPVSVVRTEDRLIFSRLNHNIPIRIYWPSLQQELPLLLYFHGGGGIVKLS